MRYDLAEHDTENTSKIEVVQSGGGSAAKVYPVHPVNLGLCRCEEQGEEVWNSRR